MNDDRFHAYAWPGPLRQWLITAARALARRRGVDAACLLLAPENRPWAPALKRGHHN